MEGHISKGIWAAQFGLDGFKKKAGVGLATTKLGDQERGMDMGGVGGGDEYAQNALYGILKKKFKRKHTNSYVVSFFRLIGVFWTDSLLRYNMSYLWSLAYNTP